MPVSLLTKVWILSVSDWAFSRPASELGKDVCSTRHVAFVEET